ncbi:hypothetical protein VPH35_052007 [Triticum aestivum]|uniref:Uncharacterized protein n=1 Tax=Triticum aestivum TaxID=4565 RepID=A0A077RSU5_WHEAT|nr:unnamed protein product [Triticum aestivum]
MVPEDEDGEAGCRDNALAATGEGGEEGRLPWPWPWELVPWKRHLKDPAWVAGAQTHLEAGLWPAPDGADADRFFFVPPFMVFLVPPPTFAGFFTDFFRPLPSLHRFIFASSSHTTKEI